ncbi:MAG TPA: DUF420 domain-containing protein [Fimbriimonadales bacterium]|nr:DUF420 domain-containing protein [Fimbriimonadales bacterium]
MRLEDLPTLNAILNTTSAILLITGYFFIRNNRVALHHFCMISAFIASTLFLVSYLTYHFQVGTTRFAGEGFVRTIYFLILGTHTILAILVAPMALITLSKALRGRFPLHKKIARWTLPIWLYVSVTGVIVYLMLYHFYPSR